MGSMRLLISLLLSASAPVAVAQLKKGNPPPITNLQLLKPVDIQGQMSAFNRSLGVDCAYCHMPADYATDDNPNKGISRRMIVLTREINEKYFGGSEQVTCFTCHHGSEMPLAKNPAR
jgi:hypothetical protein